MLESFFSRLGQSYTWLGSVNPKAAGVSTQSTDKMTMEERIEAHRTIDLAQMDQNIEHTEERLRAFNSVRGEASRAELKQQSEEVMGKARETIKSLFTSARALEKKLGDLKQQNDRDVVATKTAEKTGEILENIKKMNELAK